MNKKIRRIILLVIGLFVMSFGVAMTKFATLGVTPISSIPNILNEKFQQISLGTFLIFWNISLIIGQIIILGKNFKVKELVQLPISFLFGFFTDLSLVILNNFQIKNYLSSFISLFIGIFILALGIALTIIADVILNSGEAFVKAISDKYKKDFGKIKIIFDISCVLISIILSLIFFKKIIGTREGTILSAILTGLVVNKILRWIKNPIELQLGL